MTDIPNADQLAGGQVTQGGFRSSIRQLVAALRERLVDGGTAIRTARIEPADPADGVTVAGLTIRNGVAPVADQAITGRELADGAVAGDKIAAAGVARGKLAAGAVDGPAIAANAVTAVQIAPGQIGTRHLAAGVLPARATTSRPGMVELANTAETRTGTATDRAVTPAGLGAILPPRVGPATTGQAGVVELATLAEVTRGVDNTRAVTPAGLAATVPAATTGHAGLVELADDHEAAGGTDSTRVLTPRGAARLMDARVGAGLAAQKLAIREKLFRVSTTWTVPAGVWSVMYRMKDGYGSQPGQSPGGKSAFGGRRMDTLGGNPRHHVLRRPSWQVMAVQPGQLIPVVVGSGGLVYSHVVKFQGLNFYWKRSGTRLPSGWVHIRWVGGP